MCAMDQLIKVILSNPKVDRLVLRVMVAWLLVLAAVQIRRVLQ